VTSGGSARPRTLAGIQTWADEREIRDLVDGPLDVCPYAGRAASTAALLWLKESRGALTIGNFLSLSDRERPANISSVKNGQILVWSWLDQAAESTALARAQEPDWETRALPEEPIRRGLIESLLWARRQVRPHTRCRHPGPIATLRFDPRPPMTFRYVEEGPHLQEFRVDLGLARPNGEVELRCSCSRKPACVHLLSALDFSLKLLEGEHPEIIEAYTHPPWARTLKALERAKAASNPEVPELVWLIGSDGLDVKVGVIEAGARGPKKPRSLRAGLLLDQHPEGFESQERIRLELLASLEEHNHGPSSRRRRQALFESLIGHPQIYSSEDGRAPIRLERGEARLSTLEVDGGLRLLPVLNGRTVSDLEELRGLVKMAQLVELRPEEGRGFVTQVPDGFWRAAEELIRGESPVPPEAQAELLEQAQRLTPWVPVEVRPSKNTRREPGQTRVTVQLRPTSFGLEGDLRIRPHPGAQLYRPGDGWSEILVATPERELVAVLRDLEGEVKVARALGAELAGEEVVQWGFAVQGREACFRLVRQLGERSEVTVEWPKSGGFRVTSGQGGKLSLKITTKRDWFGVEGSLQLPERELTLAALLDARRDGRWLAIGEGQWLELDEELDKHLGLLEQLADRRQGNLQISKLAAALLADPLRGLSDLQVPEVWSNLIGKVEASRSYEPKLPKGLKAKLRPYQEDGYRWIMRLLSWGAGAVLADDMGLGKTVQALAVLEARRDGGPALVVAPTSVTYNWARELERFTPKLRPVLFRDQDRSQVLSGLGPKDVLIISYGLLVREAERFAGRPFHTLVIDEAQTIKNADSLRSRVVRGLNADGKLALSGTPIENHLGELWAIFDAVAPGLLGSQATFRQRFGEAAEPEEQQRRVGRLAEVIRPFVLRRTKAEVAQDLPPRIEVRVDVEPSPEEQSRYEDARLAAVAQLEGLELQAGAEQRRIHVLAALTRLRQLASHPALTDAEWRGTSSKHERLFELLEDLKDEGQRALVFSQFTRHLGLVRDAFEARGWAYAYLDGSTPPGERARQVETFQAGSLPFFLVSLKAGGTGLNLTAADNVIHLDPWWNPAVEDQASDRAHRIGQTRPVTIYRLVTRGTIEEQILKMHEEKRALVASLLAGSDAAARLSTDELLALLREGPPLS
jgi:superfamily II DNA or RNA helicase